MISDCTKCWNYDDALPKDMVTLGGISYRVEFEYIYNEKELKWEFKFPGR